MVNQQITISQLWVYPVKSCRGTSLTTSAYGETGLDFDRHWMIVDATTHGFLTARNIGRMILIHPTLDIPSQTLSITIPAYLSEPSSTHVIPISPPASSEYLTDLGIWGKSGFDGYSVGTPALLSALSHFMGREVLLVSKGAEKRESGEDGYIDQLKEEGVIDLEYVDGKQESSTIAWADQFPILVVNEASLAEIDERVRKDDRVDQKRWAVGGEALEMSRFRGNVVLSGAEAWTEDGWSGLMIGEKGSEEELYVAARCARCMLPNVDPETGVRDKVVPDTILRPYRVGTFNMYPEKTCFGVQTLPRRSRGTLSVGDKVNVSSTFTGDVEKGFDRPEDHFGYEPIL